MKTRKAKCTFPQGGKNMYKKILTGMSLSLLVQGALLAQNASYNANTVGIGGTSNSAFGQNCLTAVTTGVYDSGIGRESLQNTTSGSFNAGLGSRTLYQNTTGSRNTAAGHLALTNANASDNAAFGNSAMYWNTSGNHNTGIGTSALGGNTTGSYNTSIGYDALDINTTGSNNTALGAQADVSAANLTNATAVGYQAVVNASNRMWLGNTAMIDIWSTAGQILTSDQRFKSSVKADDVKGLEFIKLLRPVVYNFENKKLTEFLTQNMPDNVKKKYLDQDFSKAMAIRQSGFLAQEVEEAAKKTGYNFSGLHTPEGENDIYGISYATFVVPLVKAVQEQQEMIEAQKLDNANLRKELEEQKKLVNALLNKTGAATGIDNVNTAGITGFLMEQNEPNPFTHETVVSYTLPQQVNSAYMAVYDLSGKQIASFPIEQKGASSIILTSEKLAAGIYIYSIVADGKVMDSKRMIVAGK